MYGLLSLPRATLAQAEMFTANSPGDGTGWAIWRKRPGVTNLSIIGWGGGGGGGAGAVGANSTAAAGGGGGSSAQTMVTLTGPHIPDVMYVSVGFGGAASGNGQNSRVSIFPDNTVNNCLWSATRGAAGGNAAAGTAGAAGAAGGVMTIASMPLGGAGTYNFLAGQAGIIGGAAVAGAALTLPVTGLLVTGGTGGGGLPAAATIGTAGGAFTVAGRFPAQPGGIGGAAATTPPTGGSNGFQAIPGLRFYYGGTGGGSTHGSATGAGLVGAPGGAGGIGSGGGGGGGALTGSTATNIGGRGGDGLVIIVAW